MGSFYTITSTMHLQNLNLPAGGLYSTRPMASLNITDLRANSEFVDTWYCYSALSPMHYITIAVFCNVPNVSSPCDFIPSVGEGILQDQPNHLPWGVCPGASPSLPPGHALQPVPQCTPPCSGHAARPGRQGQYHSKFPPHNIFVYCWWS